MVLSKDFKFLVYLDLGTTLVGVGTRGPGTELNNKLQTP